MVFLIKRFGIEIGPLLSRLRMLTIAGVLFSPTLACADTIDGDRAARAGDYAAALRIWRPLAEDGDPGAQYGLAWLLAEGRGVKRDVDAAAHWCRKAADQGFAKAQYNLGLMYSRGHGVEQSDERAAHWYRLAAVQGDSDAQNNLGTAYAQGLGVAEDRVEAYLWFSLAEQQKNPVARANLGRLIARMSQDEIDEGRRRVGQSH